MISIDRRKLVLSGAAIATGLATGALAQATKLKVGFSPINEYTGLFVAKDQGFLAKRGLDVEPVLIAVNATMPAAMVSGSIDIGTPSITTTLQAVEGGLPISFICGAGVLSAQHPTISMVAKKGSGLAKPADFRGKRVGVSALNALFHVIAREWFIKAGVDPKQITFVETPFTQMYDLLRGGQVDALVAGDPILGRMVDDGVGETIGNILDAVPDNALSGNYCSTTTFASSKKELLAAFRQSIEEAHAFAKANPAATQASVAKYLNLKPEVVAKVKPPLLRSQIDRAQVDYWAKVSRAQGLLRKDVSIDSLMAGLA